ncbi:MAG: ATP-dependent helicase [Candidatus Omnitrophica bacterium]|nr:ATP-dependent helicase [Candidatus Omnitrophota bacterium]
MTRTFTISSSASLKFHLDLEQDLNNAQRAAVTCGEGPKLVIAGAGSGKTRTITYRVAFLIAKGIHPSQILLATFTNKAAREMLSRVEQLTGGDASGLWGGTFHAIGNRLLRQHGTLVGLQPNYSILDEEDQRDLIKVCITEAKVKVEEKRFPAPSLIGDLISMAFNLQKPLAAVIEARAPHFGLWAPELEQVAARYEAKKRSTNALDYDDLLKFWLKLLETKPEMAERLSRQFRHILVDEYQDTNVVQAQIVERLAQRNGRNLMVVGDDAQSIYQFRGANYDNILKFPERNPGTEIFKLETNYRSTPEILEFTNASILHNQHQHRKTLVAQRDRGRLPVVVPANDMYQEAAFVAERILQLRDDGIPLEEMAVLYRAHAHSSMLQAELIKRNIPYDVRSGVRFFEQAHIKDVVAYLKVLDNPHDEIAWRRLWLMLPRVGHVTAARLWEAIASAVNPFDAALTEAVARTLPPAAQAYYKRFQHDLRRLSASREDVSPQELIRAVMESGYADYLRAKYDAFQSRLEDLQQLAVFARPYRSLRSLLSELVLLGELYGQEVGPGSAETERLILSSVHQAKGLEWRVVFVIRMCEGSFPSEMALREERGEEEERRIFYVATTRAKDELYITHPLIDLSPRGNSQLLLQPSRFLREIRFTLYEQGQIDQTVDIRYHQSDADDI